LSPLPPNGVYSTESLRCRVGFLLLMPTDRAASSYQPLNLSLAVFFLSRLFSIADRLSFEAGALVPSVSDTCILPLLRLDVGRPDHPASLGRPESRSTAAGVSYRKKSRPIVRFGADCVARGRDGRNLHPLSAMRAWEEETRQTRWGNVRVRHGSLSVPRPPASTAGISRRI
jgi:hypothetical protein